MTPENARTNVAAELARCEESLKAARLLIDAGLLADAESPLYYTAYHAVVALLFTQDLQPRTHAGVGQMLGLHFVKTGRLSADDARLFARLQKYRLEADYSTAFVLTKEALQEDLSSCGAFVERIRRVVADDLK